MNLKDCWCCTECAKIPVHRAGLHAFIYLSVLSIQYLSTYLYFYVCVYLIYLSIHVSLQVRKFLYTELGSKAWDVMIGHFLGVDHAGHKVGWVMDRQIVRQIDIHRDRNRFNRQIRKQVYFTNKFFNFDLRSLKQRDKQVDKQIVRQLC